MKRWGMVSSIALVVAVNVFVLTEVALDRAGGVVQRVELTQRELPVAWTGDDNSGIAVRVAAWDPQIWNLAVLDRAKLVELGFDCSVPPDASSALHHYRRQLAREVMIVLSQSASPPLRAVDAGRDYIALRARYPDQSRHLIVPVLIRARIEYTLAKAWAVVGWYQLLQPQIHVPQPYAKTLQQLRAKNSYHLTLCYGKRLEPWVCGCRP